jgi:hypothetical protein
MNQRSSKKSRQWSQGSFEIKLQKKSRAHRSKYRGSGKLWLATRSLDFSSHDGGSLAERSLRRAACLLDLDDGVLEEPPCVARRRDRWRRPGRALPMRASLSSMAAVHFPSRARRPWRPSASDGEALTLRSSTASSPRWRQKPSPPVSSAAAWPSHLRRKSSLRSSPRWCSIVRNCQRITSVWTSTNSKKIRRKDKVGLWSREMLFPNRNVPPHGEQAVRRCSVSFPFFHSLGFW